MAIINVNIIFVLVLVLTTLSSDIFNSIALSDGGKTISLINVVRYITVQKIAITAQIYFNTNIVILLFFYKIHLLVPFQQF